MIKLVNLGMQRYVISSVHLNAHSNLFSGPLPSTIEACSNLKLLDLRNNSFSGALTVNFSKLTNLCTLDLASNRFKGPLPNSLSNCHELRILNLAKNQFYGEIPITYTNLSNLSFLSFSNNGITNIPQALSVLQHLKNLTTLILTKNFRGEELPVFVNGFERLLVLAIANCALDRQIPRWLLNCPKLEVLDLSWNHLTRVIPPWIGQMETTGLANPAPIIQTFYAEDEIFNDVKLDGVVTLVDAKHANIHLDDVKPKGVVNEAVEQIAYADRIIVNKTDLVGKEEVAALVQRIKSINRMAELKRTECGKVDLDYVLGIGGFDLERIDAAIDDEASKEDEHDHNHEHDHDHENCHDPDHDHHHHEHEHDHKHHDHTHDPGVSSVSIVCEGSLDLEKANFWLGTLLMDRSEDIYRMKGLLSIEGMDERFVFQGVHDIFQGSPDRPWNPEEQRVNKIVFIGKNLDAEELEKGFKSCLF